MGQIVGKSFFKAGIYLPQSRPGISDENKEADALDQMIDHYETEAILQCLGPILGREFMSKLDRDEPTGIKAGEDVKWSNLLNGHQYTDTDGNTRYWRGFRWKLHPDDDYDQSFLAHYIYFFVKEDGFSHSTGAGEVKNNPANAEVITPNRRMAQAWRFFVDAVQGSKGKSPYYVRGGVFHGALIADFYGTQNGDANLYQYINDQNDLVEDTFAEFEPKTWTNLNRMGL